MFPDDPHGNWKVRAKEQDKNKRQCPLDQESLRGEGSEGSSRLESRKGTPADGNEGEGGELELLLTNLKIGHDDNQMACLFLRICINIQLPKGHRRN